MPGKLKVQIVEGRNLPIMDRSSELTDAFVEVKFGSVTSKTEVYRKSLNPQWNSEWFRFEVDDEDLQDEPLQIRVLDHDTYSAHDAIGKVYIDLDPLLSKGNANVISGWFPIYDTMHGIRGELSVTVKVELFSDFNKFRQSSCGVQFFCTSGVPSGFRIQCMQGFVEELVVNDDPEHQWIDKIRSMRASNEARQLQFSKLTGELQRRIGLKALEMGGNAVIAYRQCFDLEGESGIVVRAVGTAVTLTKYWHSTGGPISASPHCESSSPVRDDGISVMDPLFVPPISRPRLVSCPHISVITPNTDTNEHTRNTSSQKTSVAGFKSRRAGSVLAPNGGNSKIGAAVPLVAAQHNEKARRKSPVGLHGSSDLDTKNSSSKTLKKSSSYVETDYKCEQSQDVTDSRIPKSYTCPAITVINTCGKKLHLQPSSEQVLNKSDQIPPPPLSRNENIEYTGISQNSCLICEESEQEINPYRLPSLTESDEMFETKSNYTSSSKSVQFIDEIPEGRESKKIESHLSSGPYKLRKSPSPPANPRVPDFSSSTTTPLAAADESGGGHNSPLLTLVTPLKAGGSSPLKMESGGPPVGQPPGSRVRRSSDSDISTPPKGGGSFTGSSGSAGGSATKTPSKIQPQPPNIEHVEFPFFPMRSFPPGFIVHLGAFVSAKSVKLLDRIHNPDEPETRDTWWTELRTEVRSHARSMGCHAVIGYYETTAICDEIIILSACGTAAVVNLEMKGTSATLLQQGMLGVGLTDRQSTERDMDKYGVIAAGAVGVAGVGTDKKERRLSGAAAMGPISATPGGTGIGMGPEVGKDYSNKKLSVDVNLANDVAAQLAYRPSEIEEETGINCQLCHIPYNESSLPFQVQVVKCAICRTRKVPNVLFTTVEPPPEMPLIGKGCFIQARICRNKKEGKGESHAKEISDSLPFMEIELHSQLIHKLWIKGMNTLFGLRVTFCVGDKLLVAVATATGVFSACLPGPTPPRVIGTGEGSNHTSLIDLQKKVSEEINRNVERYNVFIPELLQSQPSPPSVTSLSEDGAEDLRSLNPEAAGTEVDLGTGNKDTFVLQIDDAEDADVVCVLLDPPPPAGFDICNTEVMPGVPNVVCSLQTFTKVWRGQLSLTNNRAFSNVFNYLLRSLYFKLRKMAPCTLCHLDFDIDLPEDDEIQISITGTCAGVGDPQLVDIDPSANSQSNDSAKRSKHTSQCEDMMFDMDIITDSGAAPTHNAAQQAPDSASSTQTAPPPAGATASSNQNTLIERHRPTVRHSPVLCKGLASMKEDRKIKYHTAPKLCPGIELTPLPYIPGGHIEKYLGHLNFFIVRETTSLSGMGGLNGFIHSFIAEVMAICRAHVAALGGNALVSYQMSECVLEDNIQKNQSQCLMNVYGDVVQVLYEAELNSAHPHRNSSLFSTPENIVRQPPATAPPVMNNSPILRIKTPLKSSPKHLRLSSQT